jgi:cell division protein FtsI (penicillin-binding protein 3)
MKPINKKEINFRISVVAFFFSVFLVITVGKAVYLQVVCHEWLAQKAANQYEKTITIQSKRGTIYDANNRELAVSADCVSIGVNPQRIRNTEKTAEKLAGILGMDRRALRLKLIARRPFLWIKRQVTPKEEKAVRALKIEGIEYVSDHTRFYPNSLLGGQVVGFTGIDGRGLEGIEYYYDTFLKGKDRKLTILTDALGGQFDAERDTDTVDSGYNLILTLDRTIQYITEKALEEALVEFSGKSAMAVVMVPKTGAILAMANIPRFNPNSFDRFKQDTWRNRTITDPFEPGSTMKIFSAAAAMDFGGCTPDTIFYCENGKYRIGENTVHDTVSHGWLSLRDVVKFSSNIGAIKMSQMIGAPSLHKALTNFGFGQKTGIDCAGETTGNLMPYERWSPIDVGAISFGHGIAVSAVQMAAAVSALANDGILMKPYLVQAIRDQKGEYIRRVIPQEVRRAVPIHTAKAVKDMMQSVVEEGGTGTRAALDGYTVCGKTGTARKVRKGSYTQEAYVASFIGFVPAENPQLTIFVVIDEPQNGYYGGLVAAPVFKKIAGETLNYLNIPPKQDTDKVTAAREGGARG